MDKLNELKALADLAQQLEDNGHFVEANTVHNKFIRLAQAKTHTVSSGEKLSLIANKNGVSVDALMKANGLTSSTIYPGDVLTIPAPAKPSGPFDFIQKGIDTVSDMFGKKEAPKPAKTSTYKVSQGDTLSSIANKVGLREPSLLIKLNPGIEKGKLYPGTVLKVPVVKSSIESEYPEIPLA